MNVLIVGYRIVLPIFLIIGIGCLMDRIFKFDLRTLSKLNFYVFVPALAFRSLLRSEMIGREMLQVAGFALAHVLILFLIARFLVGHGRLKQHRMVLSLGAIFFNSGNYGFPLVAMAFGNEYLSVAAMVLVVQNLLSFTFGIWLFEKESRHVTHVLLGLLKVPVIYAVALPFLLRSFNIELPHPVKTPLDYLADGLIPVALLTLGAQLSRSLGVRDAAPIGVVTGLRLVLSPCVAALLLLLPFFRMDGTQTGVLIAMAGLPVAVNVYILASQYKRGEELASQAVFWTTLLSAITLSVLLALLRYLGF